MEHDSLDHLLVQQIILTINIRHNLIAVYGQQQQHFKQMEVNVSQKFLFCLFFAQKFSDMLNSLQNIFFVCILSRKKFFISITRIQQQWCEKVPECLHELQTKKHFLHFANANRIYASTYVSHSKSFLSFAFWMVSMNAFFRTVKHENHNVKRFLYFFVGVLFECKICTWIKFHFLYLLGVLLDCLDAEWVIKMDFSKECMKVWWFIEKLWC